MSNEQTTDSQSVDISKIAGNAPDYLKEMLGDPKSFFANRVPGISGPIFCQSIFEKLKIVEIGVVKKVEEASKDEGRVIVEVDVTEDMLNPAGSMHGGCAAALIDMCSTLALYAHVMSASDEQYISVSQTMNIIYHSPALLGDKLRLVNTTMTVGARAHSAKTEIWDVTHRRLVASGTHVKMVPSVPPKL